MPGITDFKNCSVSEALDFILQANAKEILGSISTLTKEQIEAIVQHLGKVSGKTNREKEAAVLSGLESRPQLEAVGSSASHEQLVNFLNLALKDENQVWKLSPLLVGMAHSAFCRLVSTATEEQLLLLQHEAAAEPTQHHLTLLSHDLDSQIKQALMEIDFFLNNINSLEIAELSLQDSNALYTHAEDFQDKFQEILGQIGKALKIAWNTPRLDLINSLNYAKNSCQKILYYEIGKPRDGEKAPTGIYAKIESKLFQDFGDSSNPSQIEAARDEEPAAEALIKLSIWYLRDYWEMGLLPQIKKKEDLELHLNNYSEAERAQHREKLFAEAQKSLEDIGLSTVKDLKIENVFSKRTLQEFIKGKGLKDKGL